MLRYIFLGLAAAALVSTSFIPDEALARGGRGVPDFAAVLLVPAPTEDTSHTP